MSGPQGSDPTNPWQGQQPGPGQDQPAADNQGWQPPSGAPVPQPFTLLFRGPPQFVLPQRIYRFEHDTLGELNVFIVPVGRTAAGVNYEAVFS